MPDKISLRYKWVDNPKLRLAFIERYLIPLPEWKSLHPEVIRKHSGNITSNELLKDDLLYTRYMWDMLKNDVVEISYSDAIAKLRTITKDVLAISEGLYLSDNHAQSTIEERNLEFMIEVDPFELSSWIMREWHSFRNIDFVICDCFLPWDLYLFDAGLTWCLIFTHETDISETEESRVCFSYGL